MTERTGRGAPSVRVRVRVRLCAAVRARTAALRRTVSTAQMRRYAQTEALVSDMLDEICGDERIWATYKTVRCGRNAQTRAPKRGRAYVGTGLSGNGAERKRVPSPSVECAASAHVWRRAFRRHARGSWTWA